MLGGEGEVEKEREVNAFEQFCQKILHPLLKTKALRGKYFMKVRQEKRLKKEIFDSSVQGKASPVLSD